MADLMWAEWESEPHKVYFFIKWSAVHFSSMSRRSAKLALKEKEKMREAIENKNMEEANTYAFNAARHNFQSSNFLKLSSRSKKLFQSAKKAESDLHKPPSTQSMRDGCTNLSFDQISNMLDRLEKEFMMLDLREKSPKAYLKKHAKNK